MLEWKVAHSIYEAELGPWNKTKHVWQHWPVVRTVVVFAGCMFCREGASQNVVSLGGHSPHSELHRQAFARQSRACIKTFVSCYRTPGPRKGFRRVSEGVSEGVSELFLKGFRRVFDGISRGPLLKPFREPFREPFRDPF